MATIRLTPSTIAVSNSSYVALANEDNMKTNTDSANYGTATHNRASTNNTYYVYIRNFNFNSIPAQAEVSDFEVKIKASATGHTTSTSTSYQMTLCNNTSSLGNTYADGRLSTTLTTFTFAKGSVTWDAIVNTYGSNFGIRIPLRRASSNTADVASIYGVEIEVTYTIPNPINVSSILVSGDGTISPSGTNVYYEGDTYTLTITPTDKSDEVTAERDGQDITSQLVPHYPSTDPISQVPGSSVTTGFSRSNGAFYQSSSTSSDSWLRYAIGHSAESPYSTSNTSNTYCKDGTNDANTEGWMNYPFDFSAIPSNATIESVQVKVYGAAESTSETARHADVELYSGTTLKSTRQAFSSTSNGTMTISNPGTWTRSELQNAQLRFIVGYYGGRILGATWTVTYSVPSTDLEYYTYTFTVGSTNTTIQVTIGSSGPYIPDPEDPTKTYYSLTISSINATTDPANGTTRVEAGTDHVVTITPTDPLLTLALDNGVDISDKLVGSGPPSNTYTVTTQVSGASYGFPLNSTTGYYTSNNNARSNSAAVCRVNFDLETDCLVTIEYINYAEATYDYGIFGQPNQTLGTTYTVDSNVYHACSSSSDNKSTAQTLTYSLTAGTPYIDIKYRKDSATDSYNDNLQWKITSIEATSGGGDYTYTIEDVDQKHSLIFIFGDVTYYFINSSGAGDVRLFPDGQQVKLPGDSYRLNIVPTNVSAQVTITDNGTNVTSQLEKEEGYDKQGNPAVSYTYKLSNIAATHNLIITCGTVSTKIYIKNGNTWSAYTKAYIKMNGTWVQDANLTEIFHSGGNYKRGG